ncbi:hypothetical protein NP493_29g07000 [Ridgeia piscesae]|uniref:AP180 N-terminal homology (ANTH) domain-containing protein n=1 Tax=Ridgeia piscesae TaxID=27915 RepID=A0AAD9PDF6_RIDPI|nr:hypothetical protein NP493_29g07000 [Ridgeia piscesae]
MLLFKDLIRLFACYNDGIINLLEKYFDMSKKNCREGFGIYKKFLVRMDKVAEFLKVAENVGIDKGEIPDLAKAPSSLLEALEEHLKSLESAKKSGSSSMPKPPSVTSAINKMSAVSASNSTQLTEEDKRRILEEESRRLEQLKRLKEQEKAAKSPTTEARAAGATAESPSVNPFSGLPTQSPTASADLFGAGGGAGAEAARPSDDLLALSGPNPFVGSVTQPQPAVNPFSSPTGAGAPWPSSGQMNGTAANSGAAAGFGTTDGLDFARAFNNNAGQPGKDTRLVASYLRC